MKPSGSPQIGLSQPLRWSREFRWKVRERFEKLGFKERELDTTLGWIQATRLPKRLEAPGEAVKSPGEVQALEGVVPWRVFLFWFWCLFVVFFVFFVFFLGGGFGLVVCFLFFLVRTIGRIPLPGLV